MTKTLQYSTGQEIQTATLEQTCRISARSPKKSKKKNQCYINAEEFTLQIDNFFHLITTEWAQKVLNLDL